MSAQHDPGDRPPVRPPAVPRPPSSPPPRSGPPPADWGRVAEDGTVYVRTAEGERAVGQYPEGDAAEALTFFTDRYEALAFEVRLLEQRVRGGALGPDEAAASIRTVRGQVVDAAAVGDLVALVGRLDALAPVVAEQRSSRRAEKAQRTAEARTAKEALVAEAERLATGDDWRNGANRLRSLLEDWKALPRIDRASDDALWRRFSSARTTYTRRRKTHFAEQHERRDAARVVKERLAAEAESLADSTEWSVTGGRYRDLMREWKAAGPAPREVDEALWHRFRTAQDTFFTARDAVGAEQDRQYAANAVVKEQLLAEAEALLPITDGEAAKRAFRDIADRWDAAGKVPRDRMKDLEGRIRRVEQAIRGHEQDQWRRSDPEKSARAEGLVAQLERAIDGLEADRDRARAAGDTAAVARLEDDLAARRQFLDAARRASSEFSG